MRTASVAAVTAIVVAVAIWFSPSVYFNCPWKWICG